MSTTTASKPAADTLDHVILRSGEHLDVVSVGKRWGIFSRRETSMVARASFDLLARLLGEEEAERVYSTSHQLVPTREAARAILAEC